MNIYDFEKFKYMSSESYNFMIEITDNDIIIELRIISLDKYKLNSRKKPTKIINVMERKEKEEKLNFEIQTIVSNNIEEASRDIINKIKNYTKYLNKEYGYCQNEVYYNSTNIEKYINNIQNLNRYNTNYWIRTFCNNNLDNNESIDMLIYISWNDNQIFDALYDLKIIDKELQKCFYEHDLYFVRIKHDSKKSDKCFLELYATYYDIYLGTEIMNEHILENIDKNMSVVKVEGTYLEIYSFLDKLLELF